MSGLLAFLLVGIAMGLALVVIDLLVAPVVRGWLAGRRAGDAWLFVAPGTISARVFDNLLAAALLAVLTLAFRAGGVL